MISEYLVHGHLAPCFWTGNEVVYHGKGQGTKPTYLMQPEKRDLGGKRKATLFKGGPSVYFPKKALPPNSPLSYGLMNKSIH